MTPPYRGTIVGTGAALPDRVLTNHDLEKMVDTSDEWIFTRTGIRERRIAEPNVATSDMALPAAQRALEAACVKPDEITLILVATCTPDHNFPSTAACLQAKIGAWNAGGCDLEAACAGFLYALNLASDHVAADPQRCALVVGAEVLSKFVNWKDRTSCILFGDGAGAVVVRAANDGRGLVNMEMGADGSGGDVMRIPAGGSAMPASLESIQNDLHTMHLRGRDVFRFATTKMADLVQNAVQRANLSMDQVKLIVPHQVNIRILEYAAERLGVSMDKIYCNIERYGNTSAASVPIALDEAVRAGKIVRGDVIVMVAFGAGLSWASCLLRW
jgi:3-oxoacyl-[acyl-carrier-protein] synthase-3